MRKTEAGLSESPHAAVDLWIKAPDDSTLTCVLKAGVDVRLGRSSRCDLKIGWDRSISRRHAKLRWTGTRLLIQCYDSAQNPVVADGQTMRRAELNVGESFMIGTTAFCVTETGAAPGDSFQQMELGRDNTIIPGLSSDGLETIGPIGSADKAKPKIERAFAAHEVRRLDFDNAARQIELLSALPERIEASRSDEELGLQIAELLLDAIPHAEAVAVVSFNPDGISESDGSDVGFPVPRMMRVHSRDDSEITFRPSRRLIARTLLEQKTVLHIWDDDLHDPSKVDTAQFTQTMGLGWAFASPVLSESSRGWCLYVSGRGGSAGPFSIREEDFQSDLRFTELVAQFLGSVRQVRVLQDQKTQLSSFFSPKVIDSLMEEGDGTSLEPDARDVTVLFCDVRGFSLKSDVDDEHLLGVLNSARDALGVMAGAILDYDGAIADFQGDAALGFWGWPVPLEDGPLPACRAALTIVNDFRRAALESGGPMQGFGVGVGIAHGRALAGQIGTDNQAKIGVFGRIVNLGSRLEGMTTQFGVDICIDEATAAWIARSTDSIDVRVRPLARVRPRGMQRIQNIYTVVPPLDEAPDVTNEMLQWSGDAMNAIAAGDWSDAVSILQRFPENDAPSRFLLDHLAYGRIPCPVDWDGAITLTRK